MRLPACYIPHGGGPWPFIDMPLGKKEEWAALEVYLRSLITSLPERPRALLVVSAHWEEAKTTLMTAPRPPMLYDYGGFPPETYELQWPAPTATTLVPRVRALLEGAGMPCNEDGKRGWDHGTFVPMMLSVPDADIPVLQVSLFENLDPEAHLALGRALAPLRDEGVLVIGSGNSFHNLRAFNPSSAEPSRAFDAWLAETVTQPRAEREERLRNWKAAPGGVHCHPREEHLLPLHVAAGAAGDDAATLPFRGEIAGCRVSAVHFG